jgi:hypothetical protein
MPAPIDFTIPGSAALPDPSQAFMQGMSQGVGLQQLQMQQAQQQAAIAQQQQQQQVLAALMRNPAPNGDDYARASLAIPGMREHFAQAWKIQNEDQQQANLSHISSVYSALANGQPEAAGAVLDQRAAALKNSGQVQQAQEAKDMAQMVRDHPEFARSVIGMKLAAAPGGDKVFANLASMGAESRASAKAPAELRTANSEALSKETAARVAATTADAEIRNKELKNAELQSQINERADRLGLDRDKFETDAKIRMTELTQKFGELPASAQTLVNEGALTAISSEQQVTQYQDLAGRVDQLGGSWGAGSSAHEWIKRSLGSEDAVSALKREYTRMASQGVIKLLPPGPASDKDIANAKEGIPNANASPEVVASYLRGMAKLSAYDAVLSGAKSEWAGNVKSLNRAPKDIEVDGIKVPAGTTFQEFARGYMAKKADALTAAAELKSRPYMRYANPSQVQTPATAFVPVPGTD